MVYWVAAAQILFYLYAVPLKLAFYLKSENGVRFGAGIGFFEPRFACRRAMANMNDSKKKPPSIIGFPESVKLIPRLLKELHIRECRISGDISLGDAAATALLCGSLPAIAHALHPFCPSLNLNIRPCFNVSAVHISLQGMISLRTGQIMFAVIISALNYVNRRIIRWIGIRSKAL